LALLDVTVTETFEVDATEIVTVPVAELPPVTDVGEIASVASLGMETAIGSLKLAVPSVAVIDDVPAVARVELAVTVKVPVVAPSATMTDPGTVATAVLEDFNVTALPPIGAAPVNVTVPVAVPPTEIEAGRIESAERETVVP
jgi:hypothetical protein